MHGYAADSPCSSSGRRTSRHFDLVLALTRRTALVGLCHPQACPRGALSDRDRQAETRQFLIHAALKRADQLSRLRDLPDTPTHSEEPQPQLAGLPAERSDVDPEESGSTNATPAVAIPIEIGGPSIEVPIPSPQDTPLTVKRPEIQGPAGYATSRAAAAAHHGVSSPQFFEILFGQQSASISQQAGSQPYPYPVFGSQQVQQYQYPAYRLSAVSATGVEQRADRLSAIPATGVRQPADRHINSSNNRRTAISRPVSSGNNHSPVMQTNRRVSPPALASAIFPRHSDLDARRRQG